MFCMTTFCLVSVNYVTTPSNMVQQVTTCWELKHCFLMYRKHSVCIEWSYHVLYDTKTFCLKTFCLIRVQWTQQSIRQANETFWMTILSISHWCTKRYLHKSKRLVWRRFAWSVWTQPKGAYTLRAERRRSSIMSSAIPMYRRFTLHTTSGASGEERSEAKRSRNWGIFIAASGGLNLVSIPSMFSLFIKKVS